MRPQTKLQAAIPTLRDSVFDAEFKITCSVNNDSVEVWLHGIIGDEYTQTDSASISKLLSANRGKPLSLYVNSPGGLAYDGVAIFNAIQSHTGPTTGIIEGLAGSAASLAVMACDTVKAYETSKFHPHYSLCIAMGHKADIQDTLIMMEKLDADLEQLYATRTGNAVDVIKSHLVGPHGDGTHFTATEAKAAGYVDELIPTAGKKPQGSKPKNTVSADRLRMWKRVLTK
jgi:ATP-dependent Clp protease, protease subunit